MADDSLKLQMICDDRVLVREFVNGWFRFDCCCCWCCCVLVTLMLETWLELLSHRVDRGI